jgi:hypothetical protein
MADPKSLALVARLYRKTVDGKLTWEKTVDEDVFQTSLPKFSVRLFPREVDMVLQVYNDDGMLLVEVTDPELKGEYIEGQGPYTVMVEMHKLARRNALGVDQALDNLLTQLED